MIPMGGIRFLAFCAVVWGTSLSANAMADAGRQAGRDQMPIDRATPEVDIPVNCKALKKMKLTGPFIDTSSVDDDIVSIDCMALWSLASFLGPSTSY